jgi:hypothetical protein
MTDKEVGELWRVIQGYPFKSDTRARVIMNSGFHASMVCLIRKLVQDRAAIHAMKTHSLAQADIDARVPDALRDFDMPVDFDAYDVDA